MPRAVTITRPTYTDNDSLPAATFNGVAISSAVVPDADGSNEGVIRLAGDLTGTAAAPVLVASGVTAGAYGAAGVNIPSITVDAKGRITVAANRALTLGDLGAAAASHTHALGDIPGLGSMAANTLANLFITAVAVNQTGAGTGVALVFNTPGAPTITLTPGKWLVIGTVSVRMSDFPGAAGLRFSDNAAANFFGAGSAPELATTRGQATVIGYKHVASGTFDVFFYGIPQAGCTLNFGEATGIAYAGTITAVKLEGA